MEDFVSLTILIMLLVMSPGPAFAVTVEQAVKFGKTSGVMTALGVTLGDLFHIIINLLGLTLIIHNAPKLMVVLQFLGAGYFIYIGFIGLLSTKVHAFEQDIPSMAKTKSFQRGLFVGMLNPKAMFFYLNFFAVMLPPTTLFMHKIAYSLWILMIVFVWFSFVALTLNHKALRHRFLSHQHWVKRACGLALCYFGIRLLFDKLI